MQLLPSVQLNEFDSLALLRLEERGADTYRVPLRTRGNSILSTVFVKSMDPGASLVVSYWDTSTGASVGERYDLDAHGEIVSTLLDPERGYSSKKTITRIHDKPVMDAVVTGGNVLFGVYGSLVSSFATDMDEALQNEAQPVDLIRHQGMPIVVMDEQTGQWRFLRSTGTRLQVDVPNVLQTTQQAISWRRRSETVEALVGVQHTHVNYTVPSGKRLFLLDGRGIADNWVRWVVSIDGESICEPVSVPEQPEVKLALGSPIILVAGQVLTVTAENIASHGGTATIKTWLFGSEENT